MDENNLILAGLGLVYGLAAITFVGTVLYCRIWPSPYVSLGKTVLHSRQVVNQASRLSSRLDDAVKLSSPVEGLQVMRLGLRLARASNQVREALPAWVLIVNDLSKEEAKLFNQALGEGVWQLELVVWEAESFLETLSR